MKKKEVFTSNPIFYLRTVTTLNIFQQSTSQNKDNLRLLRYCSSVGQEFIVVHWILIFRLKIFEIEFSSILGHSLFELSVFLNHWNHGHWGDHITVQIFHNFISNVLNRPSGRVSVQGVESLWGDCWSIPADCGLSSRFLLFCSFWRLFTVKMIKSNNNFFFTS